MNPSALLTVFVGGVVGGLARYGLMSVWPADDASFPTATLVVNTSGTFALAVLVGFLAARRAGTGRARLLLGTGFLGAYTTFSSVMTVTVRQCAHGHAATGLSYLAASLVLAVPAVLAGMSAGRALAGVEAGGRR
jgi:CrcB protein